MAEQGKTEQKQMKRLGQKPRVCLDKVYLFGLGVQKDIEETVNNLIEKGETKAEQREKIVDDFVKRAKEGRQDGN